MNQQTVMNEQTAMNNSKVTLELSTSGVAYVTLNNPDKHNAFDDEIIKSLTDVFNQVASNTKARVLVLQSNGKSFSAGADLGWMKRMAGYSYEENLKDAEALAEMLRVLNFMPQPTLAKVQGAAFGGAVGLAACCDLVIASEKASFCLSEVKLGLIPATIGPYVVDAIGSRASRRYFQTAERFSAAQAQLLGLVSEIVAPDALDDTVANMTQTLMANGPEAMKAAKTLVFDVTNQKIDDALIKDTSERIAAIRVSDEGQEGLTAFFGKRKAAWLNGN